MLLNTHSQKYRYNFQWKLQRLRTELKSKSIDFKIVMVHLKMYIE